MAVATATELAVDTFKRQFGPPYSVADKLRAVYRSFAVAYVVIVVMCFIYSYRLNTAYRVGTLKQKYCYPAYLISETGDYEARQEMEKQTPNLLTMRTSAVSVNASASLLIAALLIYNSLFLTLKPFTMPEYRAITSPYKKFYDLLSTPFPNARPFIYGSIYGLTGVVLLLMILLPSTFNGTKSYNPLQSANALLPYVSLAGCILIFIITYFFIFSITKLAGTGVPYISPDYKTGLICLIIIVVLFSFLIAALNTSINTIKDAKTTYDTNTTALQTQLETYGVAETDIAKLTEEVNLKRAPLINYIAAIANEANKTSYIADELPADPYRTNAWKYIQNADGLELLSVFPETSPIPVDNAGVDIGMKTSDGFTKMATISASAIKLSQYAQTGFTQFFAYQAVPVNPAATTPTAADLVMMHYINLVYGSAAASSTHDIKQLGITPGGTHIRINDYIFQLDDATKTTTIGHIVYIPPDKDLKSLNEAIESSRIDIGTFDAFLTNIPYINITGAFSSKSSINGIYSIQWDISISDKCFTGTRKYYVMFQSNTNQVACLCGTKSFATTTSYSDILKKYSNTYNPATKSATGVANVNFAVDRSITTGFLVSTEMLIPPDSSKESYYTTDADAFNKILNDDSSVVIEMFGLA